MFLICGIHPLVLISKIGTIRFERMITWPQTRWINQTFPRPVGTDGGIRTHDFQIEGLKD